SGKIRRRHDKQRGNATAIAECAKSRGPHKKRSQARDASSFQKTRNGEHLTIRGEHCADLHRNVPYEKPARPSGRAIISLVAAFFQNLGFVAPNQQEDWDPGKFVETFPIAS